MLFKKVTGIGTSVPFLKKYYRYGYRYEKKYRGTFVLGTAASECCHILSYLQAYNNLKITLLQNEKNGIILFKPINSLVFHKMTIFSTKF